MVSVAKSEEVLRALLQLKAYLSRYMCRTFLSRWKHCFLFPPSLPPSLFQIKEGLVLKKAFVKQRWGGREILKAFCDNRGTLWKEMTQHLLWFILMWSKSSILCRETGHHSSRTLLPAFWPCIFYGPPSYWHGCHSWCKKGWPFPQATRIQLLYFSKFISIPPLLLWLIMKDGAQPFLPLYKSGFFFFWGWMVIGQPKTLIQGFTIKETPLNLFFFLKNQSLNGVTSSIWCIIWIQITSRCLKVWQTLEHMQIKP